MPTQFDYFYKTFDLEIKVIFFKTIYIHLLDIY